MTVKIIKTTKNNSFAFTRQVACMNRDSHSDFDGSLHWLEFCLDRPKNIFGKKKSNQTSRFLEYELLSLFLFNKKRSWGDARQQQQWKESITSVGNSTDTTLKRYGNIKGDIPEDTWNTDQQKGWHGRGEKRMFKNTLLFCLKEWTQAID